MSNVIATTILRQLGGNRFSAMTGAKDFVSSDTALYFKLPSRLTKNGATHFTIELTDDDTYTLSAMKWNARKLEKRTINEASGVYADNLRAVFTRMTGLDTAL